MKKKSFAQKTSLALRETLSPGKQSNQAGSSIVEFALILPLLLLFFFGITDLGRAVYYLNTMEHAAREGARRGIVLNASSGWAVDGNETKAYSSLNGYVGSDTIAGKVADHLIALDLTQAAVTISAPEGVNSRLSLPLTVRVEYTYEAVSSFLGVPDIPLLAESTMLIE